MALLDLDPEFRCRRLHGRRDELPEFGRAPGIDKSNADIGAPGGPRGGGERCRKNETTQPRRPESQRDATGEARPLGLRQQCGWSFQFGHISARPGSRAILLLVHAPRFDRHDLVRRFCAAPLHTCGTINGHPEGLPKLRCWPAGVLAVCRRMTVLYRLYRPNAPDYDCATRR